MQKHNHFVVILFAIPLVIMNSCKKSDSSPCSGVSINITATVTNSDGNNGAINATATGGSGLTYSIDGTNFQSSGSFTSLTPATYTISVKNSNGCIVTKSFTVAKTKTYFLAKATWKFQSVTASGTDISNNPAIACIKDDVVTFTAAGGGTITEGAIVCSPTTAGNFTWNFQDSETKLVMSSGLFPAGSGTFTIVTLNETTLTLSQDVTIPPSPVAVPVVATYVH